MANATTQPHEKVLKIIGGLYGKVKRTEDWVGSIGGSEKNSQVAISLIEKFRMWEEVWVSN